MKFLFLLPLLISISACQKDSKADNANEAKQYLDVSYGTDARHKMDVYLPANRNTTDTKIMILIHGGAWMSGDKADFTAFVDTLKKRLPDYAVFNINYRLASMSGNYFPTQENDVKAAYDFIISKADEYNVSKKVVILGASAGGHLALLQGYKHAPAGQVKAVIDFFGPTDIASLHANTSDPALVPLIETLLSGSPSTNPSLYASSSPINFVTAQSPATIILQGGTDPLVPFTQSTSLRDQLQQNGVTNEYVYYPSEGHGWFGTTLTHSFNEIEGFLETNVN